MSFVSCGLMFADKAYSGLDSFNLLIYMKQSWSRPVGMSEKTSGILSQAISAGYLNTDEFLGSEVSHNSIAITYVPAFSSQ